ncbi:MAG: thioesterase domain-containing protein, partial [Nostoc sp.]
RGEQVEHLLIIDTHPPLPTSKIEASLEDDAAILCFIVEQIGLQYNKNISVTCEELSLLDKAAQFNYVLQILQHHELIPADSGRNIIFGLLNVYKANLHASLRYQPQPIKAAISLFKTASLAEQFPNDPTVAWGQLTKDRVRICFVAGEHQTVLKEPHVRKLAAEIIEIL